MEKLPETVEVAVPETVRMPPTVRLSAESAPENEPVVPEKEEFEIEAPVIEEPERRPLEIVGLESVESEIVTWFSLSIFEEAAAA